MYQDVFFLADPEGPIGRLALDRRVPPAVEMDHVRGRGQIQPGSSGLQRQHEERDILVLLELLHEGASLPDRGLAVQDQS